MEKLKDLLKDNGITQAELSRRIGVNTNNVQRYINGERTPAYDTLVKIAVALDLPLRDLLTVEEMEKFQIFKNEEDEVAYHLRELESLGYGNLEGLRNTLQMEIDQKPATTRPYLNRLVKFVIDEIYKE